MNDLALHGPPRPCSVTWDHSPVSDLLLDESFDMQGAGGSRLTSRLTHRLTFEPFSLHASDFVQTCFLFGQHDYDSPTIG
jgi:hypothetical protein